MKKLACLSLIFFYSHATWAQNPISKTLPKCSEIINELNYYWKVDSLANNGFRLYTHEKFLNCEIDKVDRAILFDKLGKPSEILKTNKGVEYYYYYFDIRNLPKNFDAPYTCWYISFKFSEYEKYLSSIRKGAIDL